MTFIEFRRRNGTRFLFDFASQWEIDDKGNNPALWGNHEQGRNMDCAETYAQVRAKLLEQTQPVAEPAQAQDARQPLTDEQIEALPVWDHFVGLWPENRKEIVRAIEAAHGIAAQQGDAA